MLYIKYHQMAKNIRIFPVISPSSIAQPVSYEST